MQNAQAIHRILVLPGIEGAVLSSNDGVIHAHHLPPSIQIARQTGMSLQGNLKSRLAALEQDLILDALKSAEGDTALASRFLGINKLLMRRRIKQYGPDSEVFKRISKLR
jgi:Nif-specific regulatory protein